MIWKHDGQHHRQLLAGGLLALAKDVLVQQSEVGPDAQRHVGVDAGLELEQDVEVEPAVFELHAPDDIVFAAAQVVGDVAAVDLL